MRGRWAPGAGEVQVTGKLAAAAFATKLATYGRGDTAETVLSRLLPDGSSGRPAVRTLQQATHLVQAGAVSTGEVTYVQLGGLDLAHDPPRYAAFLVVLRQVLSPVRGREVSVVRVLDLRANRQRGRWAVDRVESGGGTPVVRNPERLSPPANAVLDDARLELPDSVRWDVHAGNVDDRVLGALELIAAPGLAISVLRTGHPMNSIEGARSPRGPSPKDGFRVSRHSQGLAVDVWRVAGQPVAAQRGDNGSPAFATLRTLLERSDTDQIGAPKHRPDGSLARWDLDPPRTKPKDSRVFVNAAHDDHLHIGFPPKSPPVPVIG